jgi:hypothetical protein
VSDTGRIDGRQRLDRALVEAARDSSAATRAQVQAFEGMLRATRRRPTDGGASLRDEIERIAMPEIDDPGIFRAGRPHELLEYVLAKVLPQLDAQDEVVAIAETLLREEIARQDEIEERRTQGDADK